MDVDEPTPDEEQHPDHFGIGRLFWMTSEAIIGADLAAEEIVLWNPAAGRLSATRLRRRSACR